LNVGRGVDKFDVPHIVGLERITTRLNLENIFAEYRLLVCFLLAGFTRISPDLLINGVVRRKLKVVVEISSAEVPNCDDDLAWLEVTLGRDVAEVPFECFEFVLEQLCLSIG